jgi:hypothetical protein
MMNSINLDIECGWKPMKMAESYDMCERIWMKMLVNTPTELDPIWFNLSHGVKLTKLNWQGPQQQGKQAKYTHGHVLQVSVN